MKNTTMKMLDDIIKKHYEDDREFERLMSKPFLSSSEEAFIDRFVENRYEDAFECIINTSMYYGVDPEHKDIITERIERIIKKRLDNLEAGFEIRDITLLVRHYNNIPLVMESVERVEDAFVAKLLDSTADIAFYYERTFASFYHLDFIKRVVSKTISGLIEYVKKDTVDAYNDILYRYKEVPAIMDIITENIPLLEECMGDDIEFAYSAVLHEYKDIPAIMDLIVKYAPVLESSINEEGVDIRSVYECCLYNYTDVPVIVEIIERGVPVIEDLLVKKPKDTYTDILYKYKNIPAVVDLIVKHLPILEDYIKNNDMDIYRVILYKYKDIPQVMELTIKYILVLEKYFKNNVSYTYENILHKYKDIHDFMELTLKHLPALEKYFRETKGDNWRLYE